MAKRIQTVIEKKNIKEVELINDLLNDFSIDEQWQVLAFMQGVKMAKDFNKQTA